MTLVRRLPHDGAHPCGRGFGHSQSGRQRVDRHDQPAGHLVFQSRSVDGWHKLETGDASRPVAQWLDRRDTGNRNQWSRHRLDQLDLGLRPWRYEKSHDAASSSRKPVACHDYVACSTKVKRYYGCFGEPFGFVIATHTVLPPPVDELRLNLVHRVLFPIRLNQGGEVGRGNAPSQLRASGRTNSACRRLCPPGGRPSNLAAPCRGQEQTAHHFPTAEPTNWHPLFEAKQSTDGRSPVLGTCGPGADRHFHTAGGRA
jgi:hypothetical protein